MLKSGDISTVVLTGFFYFSRIAAFVMSIPIFGSKSVPPKIKIMVSLALTLVILFSRSHSIFYLDEPHPIYFFLILINQIVIGILFGLIVHVIFQGLVMTGQIVTMQMGLGFSSLIDPQEGISVPAVSQFYMMTATLLYLAINGHLFMIKALMGSFDYFPVNKLILEVNSFKEIAELGNFMFIYGIKIALPSVISLLVTSMAFGVMTKASPQLNVFTIGFSITMIIGFLLLWMNFSFFLTQFYSFLEDIYSSVNNFLKIS